MRPLLIALVVLLAAVFLWLLIDFGGEVTEPAETAARPPATSTTTTTTTAPPTTTTVAPTTTTTARPRSAPIQRPAVMGTGACGENLPPCSVLQRESGGNITAVSPVGMCGTRSNPRRCYGKWQYDLPTWNNYGGFANPIDAPEDVQDAKARELWAGGAGCSHWGAC